MGMCLTQVLNLLYTLTLTLGLHAVWGSVLLALGAGLLMLQKAGFKKLRYSADIALLIYVLVSVPGAPPLITSHHLPACALYWAGLPCILAACITHAPMCNPQHACSRPVRQPSRICIQRFCRRVLHLRPPVSICSIFAENFWDACTSTMMLMQRPRWHLHGAQEAMHFMSIRPSAPGDQGPLHALKFWAFACTETLGLCTH